MGLFRKSQSVSYTHLTDDDIRQMLAKIGIGSLEDLYAGLPEEVNWVFFWASLLSTSRTSCSLKMCIRDSP